MTLGIMGAMPEEVNSILQLMTQVEKITLGGREYCRGYIQQQKVVLVFSRWGLVAAAATVTTLITRFEVSKVVFTGVAGACADRLNIGDIVVSEQLYQHNMNAEPLFPLHEIPLTGNTYISADPELIEQACTAAQYAIEQLNTQLPQSVREAFIHQQPQCVKGTIASGDEFIADRKKTQRILDAKPDTLAVEMEGAAVAAVCHDWQIPFVVIRIISDRADHDAHIDFPRFISVIACHYAVHITASLVSQMISPYGEDQDPLHSPA